MRKKIDAAGLACPGPVIEAKKVLESMPQGELEVLVDNEIAVQNLKKLGQYYQAEIKTEKLAENSYQVLFSIADSAQEENVQPGPKAFSSQKIVVISSEFMGTGDQELGRVLMKGFIYALTEANVLPKIVILYNGGAKLSSEGSDSVEDLRLLEKWGVEIMTCGACLKHYGLEDKLAVGTVTNMYSIAEALLGADSIIKP